MQFFYLVTAASSTPEQVGKTYVRIKMKILTVIIVWEVSKWIINKILNKYFND